MHLHTFTDGGHGFKDSCGTRWRSPSAHPSPDDGASPPMKHLLALALPCALAAAYALPAHAEDTDDRFTIRLGAMNVDNDNTLRGNTIIAGNEISGSQDFDFGGKE